jgi:uncharacterized protein (TIRG00374 family)
LALAAAGIAVVVAVFFYALPKIADYSAVWSTLKELTWEQILLLAAVQTLNILTFAPPFMVAIPGLGFLRALTMTQASTASTYLLPGGAAVGAGIGFAMLRGWGIAAQTATLAVAVTGVWNQLFMLGAPSLALVMLTIAGGANPLLQTVAIVGLIIFAVAVAALAASFSDAGIARWVGNLAAQLSNWALARVRRNPVTWDGEALVRFRLAAIGLLRTRWWLLTLATIAGQMTVFVVLLACLRCLGVSSSDVSLVEAFAAWTLVRLLGSIPITPGGLGIVELGLTGALVGFGGANADVVAAVLLYRFLTIVPTLILGLIAGATFRLQRREPAAET